MSELPTRTVAVQVMGPDGAAMAGATVTAQLNQVDRDLSQSPAVWVFPTAVTAVTDAEGQARLTVWPNARGEDGSRYRWTARAADGTVLFDVLAAVPDADCDLASLTLVGDDLPPWPAADSTRLARLVTDIADLLADSTPSAETQRKIARWIEFVLQHVESARPWRCAQNLVSTTLGRGVDRFDLVGPVGALVSLWGRRGQLTQVGLSVIVDVRARSACRGANGGSPRWYALEGGRRVHVFPVPREEEPFTVLYQRPLTVETIPTQMESLIVNGVLGRYGRHFDRDALSQDPAEFEARFVRELPIAGRDSWDVATWSPHLAPPHVAELVTRVADGQVRIAVPGA